MKIFIILIFLILNFSGISQEISKNEKKYTTNNGSVVEMNKLEFDSFKEQILRKVKDLGSYISTLTNKEVPSSAKKLAISNAVSLFKSDSNIVQVSSVSNSTLREYEIRKYFVRISILHYSKIDVSWYDIQYISDLHKGPDGNYYGVVSIFQKFTGYDGEGNVIYQDITQKNIEVSIEGRVDPLGEGYRKVYLGNISVVETR